MYFGSSRYSNSGSSSTFIARRFKIVLFWAKIGVGFQKGVQDYILGTETTFRQTKHSTFKFTTVNKYLFVDFELNTLPSRLIFLFLFSVIVICYTSNATNCLPEVESRTQGSRPRPRTQNKSEAKNSLSEDRHSRGQGQECSRPRPRTKDTSAKIFQAISNKKKKKVFTKIFQAISTKKRFIKNFSSAPQNFNNSKNSAVLEPRTGQFSRT